ncbi:tetratricopeptide repeat protein [Flaviflagellibacter deserti]|uniref:protein O-GlcNAc transferase n=1 Tax=Flaviflagellibacter deserti TaxID=2267266 RepID=A0ABV9Z562_9HYPH
MNRKQRRAAAKQEQPLQGARNAPNVLFVHATSLQNAGKHEEAEQLYRSILAAYPDHPGCLNHLGVLTRAQGNLEEAAALLRRAVAVKPDYAQAFVNLGGVLRMLGHLDEAMSACRKAITLKPDLADAFTNLGNLLMDAKRPGEAVLAFQRTVELEPNNARGFARLGVALAEDMRIGEASLAYERALEIEPNSKHLHFHLGNALASLGRDAPALEAFKRAVALDPSYAPAYHNMVAILQRWGMLAEAMMITRKLIDLRPDHALHRFNYCHQRHHICSWDGLAEDEADLLTAEEDFVPFIVLTMDSTPAQQLHYANRWANALGAEGAARLWTPATARARDNDRIRIGYLSNDYQKHATAFLIAELLERHDRDRFEVIGYSYSPDDGSDIRRRLTSAFDRFVDIRETPDAVAARQIHADGVDILIDLKGYTLGGRNQILMWRPAPVQVNYLGYPGTMGGNFVDYIVADPFIAPFDHQPFYAERIVHLPNSYQPNDTRREIATPPSREECGLPPSGFVFCSFNNTYKITPPVFDIWMRLLKAVPGSVLWLLEANRLVKDNLMQEAAKRGVDPYRLVFAPKLQIAEHLGRHAHADLFLDTLPVNAHTTASDALWAGLPVLTCAGDTFIGRVAGSLLHAIGLPELVTHSLEEYETLALRLATDPDLLSGLRERLVANRLSAPLFDIGRYSRDLEAAYLRMWEIHQAGGAPAAFAVEDGAGQPSLLSA